MIVKKTSTEYEITMVCEEGNKKISFELSENGHVTIWTNKNDDKFQFINSSPYMVRDIAQMLLKAAEVAIFEEK